MDSTAGMLSVLVYLVHVLLNNKHLFSSAADCMDSISPRRMLALPVHTHTYVRTYYTCMDWIGAVTVQKTVWLDDMRRRGWWRRRSRDQRTVDSAFPPLLSPFFPPWIWQFRSQQQPSLLLQMTDGLHAYMRMHQGRKIRKKFIGWLDRSKSGRVESSRVFCCVWRPIKMSFFIERFLCIPNVNVGLFDLSVFFCLSVCLAVWLLDGGQTKAACVQDMAFLEIQVKWCLFKYYYCKSIDILISYSSLNKGFSIDYNRLLDTRIENVFFI